MSAPYSRTPPLLLTPQKHLAAGVVGMVTQAGVHGGEEEGVSDGPYSQAGLVQQRQNATVGLLHQLHDGLIAEVLNLVGGKGVGTPNWLPPAH